MNWIEKIVIEKVRTRNETHWAAERRHVLSELWEPLQVRVEQAIRDYNALVPKGEPPVEATYTENVIMVRKKTGMTATLNLVRDDDSGRINAVLRYVDGGPETVTFPIEIVRSPKSVHIFVANERVADDDELTRAVLEQFLEAV